MAKGLMDRIIDSKPYLSTMWETVGSSYCKERDECREAVLWLFRISNLSLYQKCMKR